MFSHETGSEVQNEIYFATLEKIMESTTQVTMIYWACAKKHTYHLPHPATQQSIREAVETLLEMSGMSQAIVTDITHHQGNTYALWAKS